MTTDRKKMEAWVRIDQTHSLRNPRPWPGTRVYGLKGELWPRLALTVSLRPNGDSRAVHESFAIYVETKAAGGEWWHPTSDVPLGLLMELREMLAELTESYS